MKTSDILQPKVLNEEEQGLYDLIRSYEERLYVDSIPMKSQHNEYNEETLKDIAEHAGLHRDEIGRYIAYDENEDPMGWCIMIGDFDYDYQNYDDEYESPLIYRLCLEWKSLKNDPDYGNEI